MLCPRCGTSIPDHVKFCPHCGASVIKNEEPNSESQRNKLPSSASVPRKKAMTTKAKAGYASLAFLLLVSMVVVFIKNLPGGDNPIVEKQPIVDSNVNYDGVRLTMTPVVATIENGYITILLSEVIEKKMVSFSYAGKNKTIDLLAYINPEGRIVTSVALCEPCNSKSFHTESNEIVCDNCGTRWNLTTLEGISGSCQKYPPDPIPSIVVGNEVRISTKVIEQWKMRI